jgi:hypothetical protein
MKTAHKTKQVLVKAVVEQEMAKMLDEMCVEEMEDRSTLLRRLILAEHRRRHPIQLRGEER